MSQLIVISAIGNDRTGVVQDLTETILDCGGNIIESRMSTLGQEFAMLLLVSGNWHTVNRLETELVKLEKEHGITATLRQTRERMEKRDSLPYAVDVVCLDHQGVVFNLARFFSSRNIDIAELSTRSYAAAHTGAPMYSVQMNISVPERIHIAQLREEFMDFCDELNLDAVMEPVKS